MEEETIRICPRCGAAMEKNEIDPGNVTVDHCPACGGIWFDGGELETVLGRLRAGMTEISRARKYGVPSILCPVCGREMGVARYPGTYVEVDFCADCGGFWLDDKELDELFGVLALRRAKPDSGSAAEEKPIDPSTLPWTEKLRLALVGFLESEISRGLDD